MYIYIYIQDKINHRGYQRMKHLSFVFFKKTDITYINEITKDDDWRKHQQDNNVPGFLFSGAEWKNSQGQGRSQVRSPGIDLVTELKGVCVS